ncbi:deoxynucleoside kinase [Streptococcus saliviloxodontae]|uniref:Adenylate kinase n=1 Tax=Streptococcus saliviloxodontae TaxID=1349416 RepID=A0ABS2PMJ1_9STRE|nr:deoxynucleoside kinase [Streptococcus saliviloxodontae]MBM7636653.1 adenylate kinase [Streptococcus saliviloxodontae]
MIISIQGSMAVGKTTLVTYLQNIIPEAYVSYEDIGPVVEEVSARELDKHLFRDYVAIQRLWIQHEIKRYDKVKDKPLVLMDFGAEEIEFYTLNYPLAIGEDWDVSGALSEEIAELRSCLPDVIIFLEASDDTLKERRIADKSRRRQFFDFQLERLLPLKRAWFKQQDRGVHMINTDDLSVEEVAQEVLKVLPNVFI